MAMYTAMIVEKKKEYKRWETDNSPRLAVIFMIVIFRVLFILIS